MLKSKKGLTLVEIILTVLIMSFGIVPIMDLAPTILRTSIGIEETTESIFLAIQKIEETRGKILHNFNKDYNESGTPFSSPHDKYKYAITDNLNPDIKTIEVNVWHIDKPDSKFILYTKIAERK